MLCSCFSYRILFYHCFQGGLTLLEGRRRCWHHMRCWHPLKCWHPSGESADIYGDICMTYRTPTGLPSLRPFHMYCIFTSSWRACVSVNPSTWSVKRLGDLIHSVFGYSKDVLCYSVCENSGWSWRLKHRVACIEVLSWKLSTGT